LLTIEPILPTTLYADWLTEKGDPRGEFIVLQHKMSAKYKERPLAPREKNMLADNGDFLGGVLDPEIATCKWQWGFIRSLRLFNFKDWMDSSFDIVPVVERVFSSPATAISEELRIGVIRWMENGEDVPKILDTVFRLGAAERIRSLHLGDVHDIDCDLAHHPLAT
jgi:hypothetical protein